MLYLDTETVGYTGPIVLIQYAVDDGPIQLYHVWKERTSTTLTLLQALVGHEVNLYNASFDAFHLNKLYNLLSLVKDREALPIAKEIYDLEPISWKANYCLKPVKCIDSYLLLMKGPLQHLVGRSKRGFKINKVPRVAVKLLKPMLDKILDELDPLLFAKTKKHKLEWWEAELTDNPELVNLKLNFYPASGLKPVMKQMFNRSIHSIDIPMEYQPSDEKGQEYRPYNRTWIKYIDYHINYWQHQGVQYATDDIEHLRTLHKWFLSQNLWPDSDIDSDLAWMVGACRHKGYKVNVTKVNKLIDKIIEKESNVPTAPQQSLRWLHQVCSPTEKLFVKNTDKVILEKLSGGDFGELSDRAKQIVHQRELTKQLDLLVKFREVGRFHPDFNVSETLTNRMSGKGGLNAQGINRDTFIREIFEFAELPYVLSGGDFEGQEVTILDSLCNDQKLRSLLKSGIKIHALMGAKIYNIEPDKLSPDQYHKGKTVIFGLIYGATAEKVAQVIGQSIERATQILWEFFKEYPGVKKWMESIEYAFCSMYQSHIGAKVQWREPAEYVESIFGFRRQFKLENRFTKFFFELSGKLKELKLINQQIERTSGRIQSIMGATQTALFAAAFGIQAKNLRTARNTSIQSSGAECTKRLQYSIWNLQPSGVYPFIVQPFNVHDEVLCPNNCPELVEQTVNETIDNLKGRIPLLAIKWRIMQNWSEK